MTERGSSWKCSTINFALVHDADWEEKAVPAYSIREGSNGEKMTDALHFIFVELGRFDKDIADGLNSQEWWMYSLTKSESMDSLSDGDEIPDEIRRLCEVTAIESLDQYEKSKYLQNMRNEFDLRTEKIMIREEGRAEGRAEGREEGRAEGRQEGMQLGRAKGLEEGQEESKRSIAVNLKAMGMTVADICKATGLEPRVVEAI